MSFLKIARGGLDRSFYPELCQAHSLLSGPAGGPRLTHVRWAHQDSRDRGSRKAPEVPSGLWLGPQDWVGVPNVNCACKQVKCP